MTPEEHIRELQRRLDELIALTSVASHADPDREGHRRMYAAMNYDYELFHQRLTKRLNDMAEAKVDADTGQLVLF